MRKEELISVVIPVYNVEKYLDNCLTSVLNQTYQNIEILLVDDGSTDESGKICDLYAKKDERIIVFHKTNGGLSSARNYGLEKSKGKYITFIDSDDDIENDYIEYLYYLLKRYHTDMSICSYSIVEREEKKSIGEKYSEVLLTTEECLERMLNDKGFTVSACAKLYKKTLFNEVLFPEKKLCEDNGTTYKIIMQCNNIAYGPESKYNYYKRENSIMTSNFNRRKLDLIELTEEMCDKIDSKFPSLKEATERRRSYARFSVLRQMGNTKLDNELNTEKEKIIDELKKNKEKLFRNSNSSLRDKAAMISLLFGNNVFNFSWKFYESVRKGMSRMNLVQVALMIVLFCTYIFPSGYLNSTIPFDKLIFSGGIIGLYAIYILKKKKLSKVDFAFFIICIFLFLITGYSNFLLFMTIPFAKLMIEQKDDIVDFLKKSKILYVCLAFTALYSIIYFGRDSRYAFTAIKEINQSGLAIFLLAILLRIKNKKISFLVFLLGMLTFSRSYYVAIFCFALSQMKIVKKVLNSKFIINNMEKLNYLNLTLLSNILLILIGIFYIWQYKSGNIISDFDVSSKIHLLDYSNFFRFTVNVIMLGISIQHPIQLMFGISRVEYISFSRVFFTEYGLPYKYTNPHNLFFSHLKQYGFFVIIEIIYISSLLKKIVTEKNLLVYLAVVAYSIILGAGLYSYWLYLTISALIVENELNGKRELK